MVSHFAGGNNSKFAELVGTNEANIRNYINGTQPKFDFISTVAEKFEINYEWLLKGKGEMLSGNMLVSTPPNQRNIRLIGRYAYADYAQQLVEETYLASLPTVPFVLTATQLEMQHLLAFELADDSMNSFSKDGLFLGDIVLGHLINPKIYASNPQVLTTNRQVFVVVDNNNAYIRQITHYNKENNTLTLHSTNPLFEEILLPLDSIRQVFAIRQVLRNLQ